MKLHFVHSDHKPTTINHEYQRLHASNRNADQCVSQLIIENLKELVPLYHALPSLQPICMS